jgi:hypothetical protein
MLCNISWWRARLCLGEICPWQSRPTRPTLAACSLPLAPLAAPGTPIAPWPPPSRRYRCRRCCCPCPVRPQPARCRGRQGDRFDLEGGRRDCWRPPRLLVRTLLAGRDLHDRLRQAGRCGCQGGLGGYTAGAPVESAHDFALCVAGGPCAFSTSCRSFVRPGYDALACTGAWHMAWPQRASSDGWWPACACRDCQGKSTFSSTKKHFWSNAADLAKGATGCRACCGPGQADALQVTWPRQRAAHPAEPVLCL